MSSLKRSGSSLTLISSALNDGNVDRVNALKNIIKEKDKDILAYNSALVDMKTDFEKIKKKLGEFERGDHAEVDSLRDLLKKETIKV